jgi:2-polyprenyl-3-methyl-5-hydroxy-6-metoxy-1,4-benzoquinol methylase
MVEAARAIAARRGVAADFEVGSLETLAAAGRRAGVVSAASVLAVVPRPDEALALLWSLVAPGGTLLLVETTEHMGPAAASRLLLGGVSGRHRSALMLWALARRGRTVAPRVDAFAPPDARSRSRHALLQGLVSAWCLQREG